MGNSEFDRPSSGDSSRGSLSGKVAVVTGGSRGLGREMVRGFASRGATVVIAGRKLESSSQVADEVRRDFDVEALAVKCHVGEWLECDMMVDRVYQQFGKIDILVNNAGLSPLYASLESVTEVLYEKVLAVNLKGPFRLGALVGTRMAAGAGGAVINISSIAAVRPTAKEIPYAAAKAGLNALTQGFAVAFAPNVRFNAIMCGPFLTDISNSWDAQEFRERCETRIPLRRAGRPAEITEAALYLASEASSYCTGAVLTLDGGSSC